MSNNSEQQGVRELVKALERIIEECRLGITHTSGKYISSIATEALQSLSGKEQQDDWFVGQKFTTPETSDKQFTVSSVQHLTVEAYDSRSRAGYTSFDKSYIKKVEPGKEQGEQLSADWLDKEINKAAKSSPDNWQSEFHKYVWITALMHVKANSPIAKSQPEDTHIMLNRLQEYVNRGRGDYWKQRCEAAESFIEFSPGDPDITGLQINAHKKWLALKQQEIVK